MHCEGMGELWALGEAPGAVQQVMHGGCTAPLPRKQGVGIFVSDWHAQGMSGHAWGGLGRVGDTWDKSGGSPAGL